MTIITSILFFETIFKNYLENVSSHAITLCRVRMDQSILDSIISYWSLEPCLSHLFVFKLEKIIPYNELDSFEKLINNEKLGFCFES